MSLKALHIVFVTAAVLLTAWLTAWFFQSWRSSGERTELVLCVGSACSALALLVYGRALLKKLKNISYL
jgi:hypothetical protein